MTPTLVRAVALILIGNTGHAIAQEASPERLIDRTPFDLVILKGSAGGEKLEVAPLDLPQRPLTTIPAEGAIVVRLLNRPLEDFELSWTNVAQVKVFEQLLLEEARRLTAAGKFDEAYDYFARLSAEYPSIAGLKEAVSDYLRRNALALYQQKQHDRALAVLLTLYQHDSKHAGLPAAVQTVAGEIIQRYLRDGNHAAARSVLDLWQSRFAGLAAPAAADWQRRFEAAARRQLDEATRLMQQNDPIAARKSVHKALGIWPKLEAAQRLLAQIQRDFPFITVGVLQPAPEKPTRRIDDWAALRTSRLVERQLAEQIDFGSEGGVYRSPFGQLSLDESGRELNLTLNSTSGSEAPAATVTLDSLSRFLLSMADPKSPRYRRDFAELLAGISMEPPNGLQLDLRRVHVRPEAMLQCSPPSVAGGADFSIAEHAPSQVLFARPREAGRKRLPLQAIVEETMPSDEAAIAAILSGGVDVLDRVPPWHIERLRASNQVSVQSYRLPTVHVLIPNPEQPLLAKREFRRALCFAIDRDWIVRRVLLGGATVPGFEVVSGPFPAGKSLSDPVRYGYNNQIAPRTFEPRLAAILSTIAWSGVQQPAGKDAADPAGLPPLPELRLAHPNDPVARVACQSIQAQLQRVGIRVALHEFSSDDLLAGRVECDLRYAELAVWEPITDARLLMDPGGIAGGIRSAYLDAALRQLDEATNWNDVRTRLAALHEIAHHELPVIPLWQTMNFFAYRAAVRGIGEAPVTLYQNVDEWIAAPGNNVAQLQPAQ